MSFVDKSFFKGLENLKFLDLGYNEIMSIDKDSFHLNSIKLEQLILKSNEIRNFDVSINNVKYLDLSYNKIENNLDFMGLNNLSSLDLSNNQLANFSLSRLKNFKSLSVSNMSSGLKFRLEFFFGLEKLDLSENNFIEANRLENMSNLIKLNLKKTNIDDCIFFSLFKKFTRIGPKQR